MGEHSGRWRDEISFAKGQPLAGSHVCAYEQECEERHVPPSHSSHPPCQCRPHHQRPRPPRSRWAPAAPTTQGPPGPGDGAVSKLAPLRCKMQEASQEFVPLRALLPEEVHFRHVLRERLVHRRIRCEANIV